MTKTTPLPSLPAPFPYFGGKSRAASAIWERLGDPGHYIEPFAGSLAVLLGRPSAPRIETVNDIDGHLVNVWRAIQMRPREVAQHAAWPVTEIDLTARHLWLVGRRESITAALMADPDWCDPRAAGWWVWGACSWIGSGWCSGAGPWQLVDGAVVDTRTTGARVNNRGVSRRLPHLGDAGRGVNRKLPHLGDAGRGVNRKLPHLGNAGCGDSAIAGWMLALSERLRRVRIACGDWRRILGPSTIGPSTTRVHGGGACAVYLDPPYDEGAMDYAAGGMSRGIAAECRAWALEHGQDPRVRIAISGYDEHNDLARAGWTYHRWRTKGGYSSTGGENANQHREIVWFSPGCVRVEDASGRLFDSAS